MFTFQSFTLLAVFAGAMVPNGVGFAVLGRGDKVAKKKYNKGTVPGSIVFGVGQAITGARPSNDSDPLEPPGPPVRRCGSGNRAL
ncbi:MAG: hypothetical protein WCC36_03460 [Gammaproteobacteria bacterium]